MTPAERLRQHQRSLAKAQRELDRERTKLEQQEKKLVVDIKKSAKAGQMVCYTRSDVAAAYRSWTHRTRVKLWRRTSSGRAATFKSSTRCARSCRRSGSGYKHYAAISKWPMPCAVQPVYVLIPSLGITILTY